MSGKHLLWNMPRIELKDLPRISRLRRLFPFPPRKQPLRVWQYRRSSLVWMISFANHRGQFLFELLVILQTTENVFLVSIFGCFDSAFIMTLNVWTMCKLAGFKLKSIKIKCGKANGGTRYIRLMYKFWPALWPNVTPHDGIY